MRNVTAALTFALTFALAPLLAAPAPLEKPVKNKPKSIPIHCHMVWYGSTYEAYFFPDGRYKAWIDRIDYHLEGIWWMEGNLLKVREWAAGGNPPRYPGYTWTMEMAPCLRKSVGGSFILKEIKDGR